MPSIPNKPQTEGSTTFDPDEFFTAWSEEKILPPYDNDFRKFIIRAFGLSMRDDYQYQASAVVTLLQTQTYIEMGAQGGLHAWYRDSANEIRPSPSAIDIAAYTDIFRPTTSSSKALTALASNAKKLSVRASIASHLQSLYSPPHPTAQVDLVVSKTKTKHVNPYFDVWAWSCQNVEWGGPEEGTAGVRFSHAMLPVLYHHFGCVCPSYEALVVIARVARGRGVVDVGSGNGYWAYMLRRLEGWRVGGGKGEAVEVVAVDSGLSEWRTMWIGDTVVADGAEWLGRNGGGREKVLILVYPMVGNDFTSKVLRAYKGTTIVFAGAQNTSGFTAFAKEALTTWMAREMPDWEKILQIPLPSFAGKDEALFVYEKKNTGVA